MKKSIIGKLQQNERIDEMKQLIEKNAEANIPVTTLRKDGISFPERYMYHLLSQYYYGEFKREVTSNELGWGAGYRYDFLVKLADGSTVVVEMQGRHHSVQVNWGNSARSKLLEEVIKDDEVKRELALNNGVKLEHYFQIDCLDSEPLYVRRSIIDSGLFRVLRIDSSKICWDDISEKSHHFNNQEIVRFAKTNPNASPQWIADNLPITVSKDQVNKILRENRLHKKHDKNQRRDRTRQNELREKVLEYLVNNPNATGVDAARALGVHRSTTYEITRRITNGAN